MVDMVRGNRSSRAETVILRAQSYTFNDAALGPRPKKGAHRPRRAERKRSFWKELPILVVVALGLTFVIQTFIARPYMIPSGSMETTLHGCPGCTPDRVLVDKMLYNFSDPEPGEVVVFKGPDTWVQDDPEIQENTGVGGFFRELGSMIGLAPPDERDFVKRIIALGGQTVKCCDKQNRVLVDGQPLDEPYIYYEPGRGTEQGTFPEVAVPKNAVFVMGDNRNNSSDSRVRGPVPLDNIIGKAQLIVWPPGRWDGISDHNPQGNPG